MHVEFVARVGPKLLLSAICWASFHVEVGWAQEAASRSATTIRQAVVNAHRKQHSLWLEYRLTSSAMNTAPAGQYIHRIVAADRRGSFYLDNGHAHQSMALAEDPYRKLSFVSPAGTDLFVPLDRVVERYPAPVPTVFLRSLPSELSFLLDWWPFLDSAEEEILGHKRCLESLMEMDIWHLRSQAELIDGHSCDVIEIPNIDAVWVDSQHGHAVRRREVFDRESGVLALRIEFGDYLPTKGGVDVPRLIHISEYDYAAEAGPDRERCVNRLELRVLEARTNSDVQIPTLSASVLPGTIQEVRHDLYELVRPDEEDHARSIVQWGRKQLQPTSGELVEEIPLRWPWYLLYATAGAIIGWLIKFSCQRLTRTSTSARLDHRSEDIRIPS